MVQNIDRDNVIHYGEDSIIIIKKNETGSPICLKILNDEFPSATAISQLDNEFELCSAVSSNFARKALQKTTVENHQALVLDFIDGLDLHKIFLKNIPVSIADKMALAIKLAQAVTGLQREDIIHGQLNPSNILVEYTTNNVFLIDFGLASRRKRINSEQSFVNHSDIEAVRYISPEQTGRINRDVDARSDLYSLGVLLYKLFTDKAPFETNDVTELIFCHIAQHPVAPNIANSEVPKTISGIILKLLAKNAEDRYQSGFGVYSDLQQCLSLLHAGKPLDGFGLGANDFSGKYFIQQKLYGRDNEIQLLNDTLKICTGGGKRLLLVSGHSGSGKSALISEIQKPIAHKNGLFIKGKFDQLQTDAPYFAFVQAFSELARFLLAANQFVRNKWKVKVTEAVGNSGKVLVDLLPDIEKIIGPQPEVAELKGLEAQNRFNYVFLNFLRATLGRELPLVIFIDDLQWADISSLDLLKLIMNDRDLKYLMVIGAYRDNEVEKEHVLTRALQELRGKGIVYDEIKLEDLSYKSVLDLVQDLFRTDQKNAGALAEAIYAKTNGNALYVHQFLKSIYEEQLLRFDFGSREWVWNKDLIQEMNVSSNVVEFITSLIYKMPGDTIAMLKTASCIGNRFGQETLALTEHKSEKNIEQVLQQPIIDGLLIYIAGQYKFAHDRIQQAIYALIPDEDKKAVHVQVAKALSANLNEAETQEKIFDIVNHWNLGYELVNNPADRIYLANLNLVAARKAVFSAAYPMALFYFGRAIELAGKDWEGQYDLLLAATAEAAESAFFSGDYDRADSWVNDIISHGRTLADASKGYEVLIKKLIAQTKLVDAIKLGLSVLDKMKVHYDIKPTRLKILRGLLQTKWALRRMKEEDFSNLPDMADAETMAAMRILSDISSASYFAAPDLVPVLIFRMIRLSVSKGLSRKSPYTFAAYGFILSAYVGEVDNGIRFGNIAMSLVDKLKTEEVRGVIKSINTIFLNHWRIPLRSTLNDLENAYRWTMESGDTEWSSYAAHNIAYHLFVMGYPLHNLAVKLEAMDLEIEKFRQEITIRRLRIFRQSITNLIEEMPQPDVLSGKILDETELGLSDISDNNKIYFHNLYFQKLVLALVFNMPKAALEYSRTTYGFLESVKGSALYPIYHFYDALAITGMITEYRNPATGKDMKLIRKKIAILRKYEKLCPENFGYKRMIIEGEYCQVQGKHHEAKVLYDNALKAASANNMTNDMALCWERAAHMFINTGEEILSRFYLQNAYRAYSQWGADAKLKQMVKKYKVLEGLAKTDMESGNAKREPSGGSFIDLTAVIKASSVLSGEIVLPNLLKKLMHILLENMGAQKGFFIMEKNDLHYIEAEVSAGGGEEKILQSVPVTQSGLLAESIVNYVYSTGETVMLDDAAQTVLFGNDEFIKTNKTKSVLCMQLLNREKKQGIIYLSNDLTASAFTEQRLALLKMLTGQIAISIENALFYSELENRVRERTHELLIEKKKSDDLLRNILPDEIAHELKQTGRTKPRSYEMVTVMFTDFKDFTLESENLSPEELVAIVDSCFRKFDEITSYYNIEKIKTIGDAYLCVSGLPNPQDHDAENVVKAALEIIEYIEQLRKEHLEIGKTYFDIRIGIHTGPIVAGVVGNKKFAYDIWGDTVNTAARMEQNSEANRINISQNTYDLIKNRFECSSRGKKYAKNKGLIEMYFVEKEIVPATEAVDS